MQTIMQAGLGIAVFISIAFLLSTNRKNISWQVVAWGVFWQFFIAFLLLNVPGFNHALQVLASFFEIIAKSTAVGTSFVFGFLGGGATPFEVNDPTKMFIFAINPLMSVFVISAISGVLWHYGILPKIIQAVAYAFKHTMRVSGSVAFSGSANIFFSMTEVITMIRPALARMNQAELLQMMTVGMTTIAGSMFIIYAQFLAKLVPNAMEHVLTASFIHMPAGLMLAYILMPENNTKAKPTKQVYEAPKSSSGLDAFFDGALSGIPVVVNCVVVLVAVLAALHMIDGSIGWIFNMFGVSGVNLAKLLSPLFAPLAWLMGISSTDMGLAGELLGTKTIVNEFVALLNMSQLAPGSLSASSALVLTYALVSFANITTAGIMVAALYALIPNRKSEIAPLAIKCTLAGLLATCCTGSVISILSSLGLV